MMNKLIFIINQPTWEHFFNFPIQIHMDQTLFHRTKKICSKNHAFQGQIKHIKTLISWNSYPTYVPNSFINRLNPSINSSNTDNNSHDRKVFRIDFPY